MKFRKAARKEHREVRKQKRHAQSIRYLEWQRTSHGTTGGGKIQKQKGRPLNMRGINGQMNRIFTKLDIYERPQEGESSATGQKRRRSDRGHENSGAGEDSDDSEADLGDRLERAYGDQNTQKKTEVKESREDRIARLRLENEAEDKEIAKLEKLLYLNKRKNNNMPKSFIDEGLDFIMELVDTKYKKRYNDSMELLEEGELGRALSGKTSSNDNKDVNEEDNSADELLKENEKRRKIKFADELKSHEYSVDEAEEDSHGMLTDDEFDHDDFDDEEEDEEEDSADGSDDQHSDEEGLSTSEEMEEDEKNPDGREDEKRLTNKRDAENILSQLKAMREAKKNADDAKRTNEGPNAKRTRTGDDDKESVEDNNDDDDDNSIDEELSDDASEQMQGEDSDDAADASGDSEKRYSDDEVVADDFIRKKNKVADDGTYEDIYGRKRDARGELVETGLQKYVPPAKRLAMCGSGSTSKLELEKLQKQVKGLINRLSETNLRHIGGQMSELYARYSKNNVTSTLSVVISDAIFGQSETPERLVLEPALLCALLHANEGNEVGAQILEDIVDRLKSVLENEEQRRTGKQLANMLRFLCYLFLFKVVSHGIVYGVLNKLDPTNEFDVELILVILKTCGFALRKCDPLALKELIVNLQSKCRDMKSSTRHRFMLDTLLALKNNNISKISNCDPSLSERALKSLRTCLNKNAVLQGLNVSLEDLYNARMKGKWWLIGSAWSDQGADREKDVGKSPRSQSKAAASTDEFSSQIVELAAKVGMNTDIRRSIFCIIMSAQDYLDAGERLLRLNLTHVQQRELCYVLLLCAGNEKAFNPYYAHLGLFFCRQNKKIFSMTLQCAIWDAIKSISSFTERKVTNLARFTALLIYNGGLPLAVLKNVEFVDLCNDKVIHFLRTLLLDVLLNLESNDVSELFAKVALAGPKLALLKEGLIVFFKRFLLRNVQLNDKQKTKVRANIKAAEEGLNTQLEKPDVDIFD